jgi:GAF domain-containing protein
MDNEEHIQSEPLKEIVTAALEHSGLYERSEILKHIATAVNAYACVIWELAPNTTALPDTSDGYLFVAEKWFADNQLYAFHDLPLQSVAGHTVLTQKTINVLDTHSEVRISEDPKFLQNLGIHTLLSVPIMLTDATKRGALHVYRKQPTPFSDDEIKLVQQLALLLPLVNETIRVKAIFNLMRGVDKNLSQVKLNRYVKQGSKEIRSVIYKAIEQICKLCSSTFDTVETSIFLDNRMGHSEGFDLIATTWPLHLEKTTIEPHDKGLTRWVLTNKKSVRIFDLANFERDHYSIINQYPNLHWHDSVNTQDSVRTVLQLRPEDTLPPLSFMACPILTGEKVVGAIRCYISKSGSYFNSEDVSLLELVAAKVSQYWTDWIKELEVKEENKLWQEFSVGFSELNTFVLYELIREKPDANQIFAKAMKLIESVIKGVDGIDIRLLDENKPELFTAAVYGDAWIQGASTQASNRRTLRFPVNEQPPLSAGAHVIKTGKVHVIADTSPDLNLFDTAISPSTKQMIIAPIKIEDQTFGVLDIHVKDDSALPRNAVAIVELVGLQLGLYHYLIINIGRLRAAEVRLDVQVKERVQALDDLTHQLRSPINQAYARIESVLRDNVDKDLASHLFLIRGLFRKAKRVTSSIGLFAALASNQPPHVDLSVLDYEYLVKMLTETATDSEMLIELTRNIRVQVDRNSFEPLRRIRVEVDKNLLEQAIGNILDNALKYSYQNTVIKICGGLIKSNRFFISVTNVGLPIKRVDIDRVVERGWRSADAKLNTGEGSGIGLWIVANIMKGLGGELEIIPTNSNHVTEVKLLFQAQKG